MAVQKIIEPEYIDVYKRESSYIWGCSYQQLEETFQRVGASEIIDMDNIKNDKVREYINTSFNRNIQGKYGTITMSNIENFAT